MKASKKWSPKLKPLLKPRWRARAALAGAAALLILLHVCGLHTYFLQKNYFGPDFSYPSDVNLTLLVWQMANREAPDVAPTNHFRYQVRLNSPGKCVVDGAAESVVDLLFVVKSAVANHANRMAIRETWASEKRFAPAYTIRRIFLVAMADETSAAEKPVYPQSLVEEEQRRFQDLVQGDFLDRYHNNTLKTIMGLHWVTQHCPRARFVLFADDDFYVSTKNLLRFLENPDGYPDSDAPRSTVPSQPSEEQLWYTGHVFFVLPVRFPFHKFYVTLEEYPYNIFPPFINAGAFLLTRRSLALFYYGTLYTAPLKLDDAYLGIVAKKLSIEPTHNRYFFPYKVPNSASSYQHLIACHGYRDPQELVEVHRQQVAYGNA